MTGRLEAGGTHRGGKLGFNQIRGAHRCFILKPLIASLPCTSRRGVAAPAESTDGDCQTHASNSWPSWRQLCPPAGILNVAIFQPFLKLALNTIFKKKKKKTTFLDAPSSAPNKVSVNQNDEREPHLHLRGKKIDLWAVYKSR